MMHSKLSAFGFRKDRHFVVEVVFGLVL